MKLKKISKEEIEWREHPEWRTNRLTAVKKSLKDKHERCCLCYSCRSFKPNTSKNCSIAQATLEHNIKYNIVTPMWECPEYNPNLKSKFDKFKMYLKIEREF